MIILQISLLTLIFVLIYKLVSVILHGEKEQDIPYPD